MQIFNLAVRSKKLAWVSIFMIFKFAYMGKFR